MKKRTHLRLTRYLIDSLDIELSKSEKLAICLGSVFPDLTPLCVIKPHTLDLSDSVSLRRIVKVSDTERNSISQYFILGCLSHFVADYFTAPHNHNGVLGFCTNHRSYENELDRFFINNLGTSTKYISNTGLSTFWDYLLKLHEEYEMSSESYSNDFEFITQIVDYLFTAYFIVLRVRVIA